MDIFTTGALVRVIDAKQSEGPVAYFRDRYWTQTPIFSTDEKIYFDVIDRAERLAPYVSPLVEGKVMEHRGFSTRVFEPPYLKPKAVVDPNQHMFHRRPGEAIGGNLSPQARRDARVNEILTEHEEAIRRREEVQAVEALRRGQVTVTGDGYGTVVLDFGRDASLTVILGSSVTWDNAGIEPLKDIEGFARQVFDASGAAPRDVYFGLDAWDALLARISAEEKQVLFDSRRGGQSQAELGPNVPDYINFRGMWGEFRFWTVSKKHQDEDGNQVDLYPPKEVTLVSEAIEGTPAYAAIRDPRAGFASVRAFPKNWMEEDPAVEFLMTQSAPLMVPLRPNASLGATVLP